MSETTLLYRPISSGEMQLIKSVKYRAFPPRLFWQPTYHPVLNEEYATQIARDWHVCDGKPVYVVRFQARTDFLQHYEKIQTVEGQSHQEYHIPTDELKDLEEFNKNIVGTIEVVTEFQST